MLAGRPGAAAAEAPNPNPNPNPNPKPEQADLERLLQKRGSFDALRATLSRLIAKEQQDPNPKGGGERGSAGTGDRAGARAGGRGGAGLSTSSSFAGGAPSGGLRSSSSGQGASLMQPSRRG